MKTSSLINATRQYDSVTSNGAVTHSTSLSKCMDFFFIAGASRSMDKGAIITSFLMARSESIELAYKILFWARDCRGGAGERRIFKIIGEYCKSRGKLSPVRKEWDALSSLIPTYGSWKDFFTICDPLDFHDLEMLAHHLLYEDDNLCAKWMPRKGPWFNEMMSLTEMSAKDLRKLIVGKTQVVETQMCNREWDQIEYSKVPSVAMNQYRNAFGRRDTVRFAKFNEAVLKGDDKVNASVLFPHQLYQALAKDEDETAIEAQWKSLPNYMEGSSERILPVCDVSGSMHGLPMDVSVSLGLYIAERNEGAFRNAFMTFSQSPTMNVIQGETLADKLHSVRRAEWGFNTDLRATFKHLLESAVRESVSADEMPTKILIISDMEFDQAVESNTNLDAIRDLYSTYGYELPGIIFWNVEGRLGNVPAKADDANIGLVSGFSPAILTSILGGEDFSPLSLMMKAVDGERYSGVTTVLGEEGCL